MSRASRSSPAGLWISPSSPTIILGGTRSGITSSKLSPPSGITRIGRDSDYYGAQAEAEAAADLRVKRYIARESTRKTENITEKVKEIAKRVIRREFGVKRICEADIKVSKFNGVYTIGYKGKAYRLH